MAAPTRNTGVGSACENTGSIGLPACLSRGVVEVESKVASFSPEAMALDTVAWPLVTKTGFGLHRPARELPLDALVEAGAQAAGEGDRDAGKALLEILDPAIVGAGWSGAVEREGLFQLRLLIKRAHALGPRL